jgi:hypothetical protein
VISICNILELIGASPTYAMVTARDPTPFHPPVMRFIKHAVAGAAALAMAACGNDVEPLTATSVHGVVLTVTVPGRCLVGGCDPASSDATTLGLARVVNTGSSTAYLALCGSQPAFGEQQLIGGTWSNIGPAISCVSGSASGPLAPGDSLRINEFFAAGRRRLVLTVSSVPSMADAALATSAAFDVR